MSVESVCVCVCTKLVDDIVINKIDFDFDLPKNVRRNK